MVTTPNGLNWETLAQQAIPDERCYALSVLAMAHRQADPNVTPVGRNGLAYPIVGALRKAYPRLFSPEDITGRRWQDLQDELEGIAGGYRECL